MPKKTSNKNKKASNKNKKTSNKNKKALNKNKCPPNMNPIKIKDELLCVGRCPHSGGPIYYNPKLDKLVCKWHGSQFTKKGKVLTPPAMTNLSVKKI